jgi:hypothetical protein
MSAHYSRARGSVVGTVSGSYLEAQDLGLDERERAAVDLNQTTAGLAVGDGGGRLLLAEALHTLRRRHGCWMSWLLSEGDLELAGRDA